MEQTPDPNENKPSDAVKRDRARFAALAYLGSAGVGATLLIVALVLSPPGEALRGAITQPLERLTQATPSTDLGAGSIIAQAPRQSQGPVPEEQSAAQPELSTAGPASIDAGIAIVQTPGSIFGGIDSTPLLIPPPALGFFPAPPMDATSSPTRFGFGPVIVVPDVTVASTDQDTEEPGVGGSVATPGDGEQPLPGPASPAFAGSLPMTIPSPMGALPARGAGRALERPGSSNLPAVAAPASLPVSGPSVTNSPAEGASSAPTAADARPAAAQQAPTGPARTGGGGAASRTTSGTTGASAVRPPSPLSSSTAPGAPNVQASAQVGRGSATASGSVSTGQTAGQPNRGALIAAVPSIGSVSVSTTSAKTPATTGVVSAPIQGPTRGGVQATGSTAVKVTSSAGGQGANTVAPSSSVVPAPGRGGAGSVGTSVSNVAAGNSSAAGSGRTQSPAAPASSSVSTASTGRHTGGRSSTR